MSFFIGIRIDDTDTFNREGLPPGHPNKADPYGHAMLTLTAFGITRVWDLMPTRRWPPPPIDGEVYLTPVSGVVNVDTTHEWDFEKRVAISEEQYEAVFAWAMNMSERELQYHAFPATLPEIETYSCMSFVQAAFQVADVVVPGFTGFVSPATVKRLDPLLETEAALAGIPRVPDERINASHATIIHSTSGDSADAYGSKGVDVLLSYRGGVAHALEGNDLVHGSDRPDYLAGDGGNDEIDAAAGSDIAIGGANADLLRGGAGSDWLWGDEQETGPRSALYAGANYGGDDNLAGDTGDDYIVGGGGGDRIKGDAGDDFIWGDGIDPDDTTRTGRDTICGGAGKDVIYAGAGDDVIYGECGPETPTVGMPSPPTAFGNILFGNAGADSIYGDAGKDTIDGGTDNDRLVGNFGDDSIKGGAGDDIIYGDLEMQGDISNGRDTIIDPAENNLNFCDPP